MSLLQDKDFNNILLYATATVITVAAVIFIFTGCSKKQAKEQSVINALKAVPVDVSAIILFPDAESAYIEISENDPLFGSLMLGNGDLKRVFGYLYSLSDSRSFRGFRQSQMLISAHYSARDRISGLMVITLEEDLREQILSTLNTGGAVRDFGGLQIFRWQSCEIALYKEYLLASDSPLILESSIRHLRSGASIYDNQNFSAAISGARTSGTFVVINHSQIGKLFSGFSARNYLKYSDFVSRMCEWSVHNIEGEKEIFTSVGTVVNNRESGNYIFSYNNIRGAKPEAPSVLPHSTFALLAISVKDVVKYSNSYSQFRDYYKKDNEPERAKAVKWIARFSPAEVACALIPYGGVMEGVTLIRKKSTPFSYLKSLFSKNKRDYSPENFEEKGYMRLMFGDFFSNTNEESILITPKWVYIGPETLLKEIAGGAFDYFTFQHYINQTKARNLLGNHNTLLTFVVNGSEYPNSLSRYFNSRVRPAISQITTNNNLLIASYQLVADKSKGVGHIISAYADSVVSLPSPPSGSPERAPGWESDTIVPIPKGPFQLIHFETDEAEYLEQLQNNWLRLSDKNKKGIWAIPFSEPIRGFVRQVDFYNNGKLQMLFASENKLFLLDRTGRFVNPFPVKTEVPIVLGPMTYAHENRGGNYVIMLLHNDNTLRLYDKWGRPAELWNNITLEETIKQLPELAESGGYKFWIVRTSVRTEIFTINGNLAGDFSGRNMLKPNTQLIFSDKGEVRATTISDRDIQINLLSGQFKRIR